MEPRDVLRNLRNENDLTLQEMSEKIGIPASTISTWERGAGFPRGKYLKKVCDFFGVDEAELREPTQGEWTMHPDVEEIADEAMNYFKFNGKGELLRHFLIEWKKGRAAMSHPEAPKTSRGVQKIEPSGESFHVSKKASHSRERNSQQTTSDH